MDYSDEELEAAYNSSGGGESDSGSTWSDDELEAAYHSGGSDFVPVEYDPDPRGFGERFVDNAARFGLDAASGVAGGYAGLARALEENLGTGTTYGENLARNVENTRRYAAEQFPIYSELGQNISDIGSGIAPALLSGPLAPYTIGGQAAGQSYQGLREQDVPPVEAAYGGLASGTAAGLAASLTLPRAVSGNRFAQFIEAPIANLIGGTGQRATDLAVRARALGEVPTPEELSKTFKQGAAVDLASGLALGAGGYAAGRIAGKARGGTPSPVDDGLARMQQIAKEDAARQPEVLDAPIQEQPLLERTPYPDQPHLIDVTPVTPNDPRLVTSQPEITDPLIQEILKSSARTPEEQAAAQRTLEEVRQGVSQTPVEIARVEPSRAREVVKFDESGNPVIPPKTEPAEKSFPESVTKVEAQPDPTPQVKPPSILADERGSFDYKPITDLAKGTSEYFDLLTKPEGTKEIANIEKFLEGRIADRSLPGASQLLQTTRRQLTFPATMAQKSEPWSVAYKAARGVDRTQSAIRHDMLETFRPYSKLPFEKRLPIDIALAAARESTKTDTPFKPTPENLSKYGLDAEQIDGYLAYRKTMEQGFKALEKVLFDKAARIPDERDRIAAIKKADQTIGELYTQQYVPFSRYGNRFVSVPDANDGKGHVSFHKTTREMQNEVNKWRKLGFEPEHGTVKKPPKEAYDALPLNLAHKIASLDPEAAAELAKTLPPRGFSKHTLHAELTPGYEKDLGRSGIDYIEGLSRYLAHSQASPEFDRALEMSKLGSKEHAMLKKYVDDMRSGQGGLSSKYRKFANHYYLSGVTRQALVNLTQNVTLTYPLLGEMTKNPKAQWIKAAKLETQYLNNPEAFAKNHPELAKSIAEGKRQGLIEDTQVKEDAQRLRRGDSRALAASENALDLVSWMQRNSEYANQLHAWIAGHNVGNELGLSPEARFDLSVKLREAAHFITSKANQPEIARRFPISTQFKLWNGNFIRAMRNSGGKTRLKMLGGLLAIGGGSAVPGVAITMRTLQNLGIDPFDEMRKIIGRGDPEDRAVTYGLPADIGANVSGSLALTDPVLDDTSPTNALGRIIFGTAYDSLYARPKRAIDLMKKYDHSFFGPPERGFVGRAGEAVLPDVLRNPAAALRAYQEGGFTGPGGNMIMKNPTTGELILKGLGITPTRLTESYERDQSARLLQQRQDAAHEGYNYKVAKALREKDTSRLNEIRQEVRDYNTSHEGSPIRIDSNAVRNKLREWADEDAAKIRRARKGEDRRQIQQLLQRR